MWKLFNRFFFKPEPPMNAVAGVVNSCGGFRVVCGPLTQMWCHVEPGEKLYLVPELWVPDSRPIQHIAELIEIVNAYINEDHPPDIMRF